MPAQLSFHVHIRLLFGPQVNAKFRCMPCLREVTENDKNQINLYLSKSSKKKFKKWIKL